MSPCRFRSAVLFAGLALTASTGTWAQGPVAPDAEVVEAALVNNQGATIGRVTVRGGESATVVRITVDPGGLTPGWHGLHFHAVGDCSDVARFEASKGHVNQEDAKHGLLNPEGPDEGDLPNLFAAPDGSVKAEVSTHEILLTGEDDEPSLRDQDGSALIIHAGEDDHTGQPIGNAGARVACAVIKPR